MATQYYAITIKVIKQGVFATEEQLKECYDFCLKKYRGRDFQHVYEVDSMGRLHLHGCFSARRGLYFKSAQIPFTTIYCKAIPSADDKTRWISYCNKEKGQRVAKNQFSECIEYPFQN